MNIIAIGINHKTAPIEIREKLYLNELQQELLLSELKNNCSVAEAIVISTCNRTEIFAHVLDEDRDLEVLIKKLFEIKEVELSSELRKRFYIYEGKEAVEHLFRVITGLDSLALGEKQILGQVKDAIERSRKKAILGRQFNILSNFAVRAGKKAQHETDISFGGASISGAAVAMAEKMQGSLENKKILIMGAGKMGELAGDLLKSRRAAKIYVMNRTRAHAVELAKHFDGIPVGFWDIKEVLTEVDVGICAVDAPHYILEKATVETAMTLRCDRKLFLIDISIPRNIDPQAHDVPNVELVHIDDLEKVVEGNMARRRDAIPSVEKIIRTKLEDLYQKLEKTDEKREAWEYSET